ncbi:hypothetical protein Bbelb_428470 [Branchiostoma belcheri]|nr:hypothetical protein Bbelb_428470 [Branchiostoma belcheri]
METSLDRNCEIVWAKVKLRGKRDLLIGSYYRPHEGLEDSLREMAESARLACQSSNAIVVLGGDFNLPDWNWEENVLKPGSSYPNIHRQFMDIISDLGMEQIVEKPTRGENTLDIIVTNHPSLFPRVEIVPGLSDHDIPYAELQITNPCIRQKERQVLWFKKADWEGLRKASKELTESVLGCHTDKPDVEAIWMDFKTGMLERVQKYIPLKKVRARGSQPWISNKTRKLIRRRDRIHKKYKKTKRQNLFQAFKSLKRQVQQQLRREYWDHVQGLITEDCIEKPKPTKKFWAFVKSKRNENSGVSPLKVAGKLITDDKERAEILNSQFQSAFSAREDFSEEEFKLRTQMPPRNPEQPTLEDIIITTAGVEKLLRNLDPSKASGPDQLSPRILREVATEIAPLLAFLYQISLDKGVVPNDWKCAHVCPVFKKGERYKAENYRPISLTSIPCKLLEHILVSEIMSFCEEQQILCTQQHGFRKGRSCETQLLGLADEISHTLEDGHQEDLLVLDFSKAFDKVSHSLLVHKLKYYRNGIDGKVNTWISEFLADRKQAVVVNGSRSEYVSVESGVPQGSVLGPSLFLLFINDLPVGLSSVSRLFADDTACHDTIKTTHDQVRLQEDLNKLAEWEGRWKMSFHPQKCSIVHMTRKKKTLERAYELHGHKLQTEPNVKYLGVTLTKDLKWSLHISNISSRANRSLGFVRRNIKINSKSIKEAAYRALVRSSLEYASSVWDPHSNKDIATLEKVQRRAARWVCSRYRQTSSVESMLEDLEWETLQQRRRKARLTTFYKLHHGMITVDSRNLPTVSQHKRQTRRSHPLTYDMRLCRTTHRQMSFFPRTVAEWNSLPAEVVSAKSLDSFKNKLDSLQ